MLTFLDSTQLHGLKEKAGGILGRQACGIQATLASQSTAVALQHIDYHAARRRTHDVAMLL